ncbi:MAG TPA: alpha/beta hydrolase [Stellaceae bacterium]|jgi:acetyl esterase/lipase|nr:alpha/beta hydrolase [Stellaceae bacterium]
MPWRLIEAVALDPHVKRLLGMVAAAAPGAPRPETIEERRQGFAKLMALSGIGMPVAQVEDRTAPGPGGPIPVRLYTPFGVEGEQLPGLVFFHGGGLVAGGVDTHDSLARALANETRARLISVDYRLAPEHPFPAAVIDCRAAFAWAIEHAAGIGIDPDRVAIAGDSAGATLAALVCQQLATGGARQPLFQLLLCPITDFAADTPSRRQFGKGYLIDSGMIASDLSHYLPRGITAAEPAISPLRASDLRGVCPAYIHTAEADPLRDEGEAYAMRLRGAGVVAHYTCHSGMIHLFYGMAGIVPYARTALTQIGGQVRAAFAGTASPAEHNRLHG